MRRFMLYLLLVLSLVAGVVGCTLEVDLPTDSVRNGPGVEQPGTEQLDEFEEVATYIAKEGKLPDRFITKNEARKLGWDAKKGNLAEVAPGKSIGGDRFHNREGLLPMKEGRIWYEADIHYVQGHRGSDRIVYSNDGLIYKTTDHYASFTEMRIE